MDVLVSRRAVRTMRVAIVVSSFHPAIARRLVRGATDELRRAGVATRHIRVVWVPGAFELPAAAAHLAHRRQRPDAVIALGAVIKGETPQYAIIAQAVAQSLAQLSVDERLPVTFGVIVATTLAQAKARSTMTRRNRGAEAARAALSLVQLFDTLPR